MMAAPFSLADATQDRMADMLRVIWLSGEFVMAAAMRISSMGFRLQVTGFGLRDMGFVLLPFIFHEFNGFGVFFSIQNTMKATFLFSRTSHFETRTPHPVFYTSNCAFILNTRVAGRLRMSLIPVSSDIFFTLASISSMEGAIKVNQMLKSFSRR